VRGTDEAPLAAMVVERAAQVGDEILQVGVMDDDVGPERVEELVVTHDRGAALEQEVEQRHRLRREVHRLLPAKELQLPGVVTELPEFESHAFIPFHRQCFESGPLPYAGGRPRGHASRRQSLPIGFL